VTDHCGTGSGLRVLGKVGLPQCLPFSISSITMPLVQIETPEISRGTTSDFPSANTTPRGRVVYSCPQNTRRLLSHQTFYEALLLTPGITRAQCGSGALDCTIVASPSACWGHQLGQQLAHSVSATWHPDIDKVSLYENV